MELKKKDTGGDPYSDWSQGPHILLKWDTRSPTKAVMYSIPQISEIPCRSWVREGSVDVNQCAKIVFLAAGKI